jgi:hypothetical protein
MSATDIEQRISEAVHSATSWPITSTTCSSSSPPSAG